MRGQTIVSFLGFVDEIGSQSYGPFYLVLSPPRESPHCLQGFLFFLGVWMLLLCYICLYPHYFLFIYLFIYSFILFFFPEECIVVKK